MQLLLDVLHRALLVERSGRVDFAADADQRGTYGATVVAMGTGEARDSGLPSYDRPLHRDPLFLIVLAVSLVGGAMRPAAGHPWWQVLSSVGGGVFLLGVLLGSAREFVRGLEQ